MIIKTTDIVVDHVVVGVVNFVSDCPGFSYEAHHNELDEGAGCENFQEARQYVLEQHEAFLFNLPEELEEHEEEIKKIRLLVAKYCKGGS